ncbi:MAG: hydroxyacid dehydrogenase, partial [Deltaproteobacteria bacterium]|nr:hydroxyacid dehydrogenase [Deltaproteobacteria bacterium]
MNQGKRKAIIAALSWNQDQVKLIENIGVTVKVIPDRVDALFHEEVRNAEALIVGLPPISRQTMENAPNLMIIACQGVGFSHVDLEAANQMGILVTNTPGVNSDTMAEYTLGLILAIVRRIPHGWVEMVKGGWDRSKYVGTELRGKTLSILGFGQIGRRVSKMGAALGMKVLAWSRTISEKDFMDAGAQPVSKDQAISQADILSLHLTLNKETQNIIGSPELAMMKPTAFLINTARGGLVDQEALLKALDNGVLAGAAIDVFEQEPPTDRRLIEHPRVLATPHLGALTEEARYRMCIAAAEQVVHALRGEKPPYTVNNP